MKRTKGILVRLKTLRESKGLKRDYIAQQLSIPKITYIKKEKGLRLITIDEWIKISKILETDLAYFFKLEI